MLCGSLLVNVFAVAHIEITVIVLGIVNAILSGTTVVPGCSDFARMYLLACGRRERSDRFPLFAAETTHYKVTHSITFSVGAPPCGSKASPLNTDQSAPPLDSGGFAAR